MKKEAQMLEKIMGKLPEFTTQCRTAQLKRVQHNSFDIPKELWCCWVTDNTGNKLFAMYNPKTEEVKTISEDKKKKYIVKHI